MTKWAQRSDKVYITIELPDAKDVKLILQPEGQFHFSAASGVDNTPYELDFELFDKVNVDVRIIQFLMSYMNTSLFELEALI